MSASAWMDAKIKESSKTNKTHKTLSSTRIVEKLTEIRLRKEKLTKALEYCVWECFIECIHLCEWCAIMFGFGLILCYCAWRSQEFEHIQSKNILLVGWFVCLLACLLRLWLACCKRNCCKTNKISPEKDETPGKKEEDENEKETGHITLVSPKSTLSRSRQQEMILKQANHKWTYPRKNVTVITFLIWKIAFVFLRPIQVNLKGDFLCFFSVSCKI